MLTSSAPLDSAAFDFCVNDAPTALVSVYAYFRSLREHYTPCATSAAVGKSFCTVSSDFAEAAAPFTFPHTGLGLPFGVTVEICRSADRGCGCITFPT